MNRQDSIVSIFRGMGGTTTLRLAQECIGRGLFGEEDLRNASVRWAQGICREALKQIDPITKLPFAGPTATKDEGGGRTWQQLELMGYEDLATMIQGRIDGLVADYTTLVRIRDYCLEQFGRAPEIPEVMVPALGSAWS